MSPPGVSVVVVNWNTRDMVLRMLENLSPKGDHDGFDIELIVVDNDSSDGSAEAIREEFPEVTLVAQNENKGFAGGVNPGVRAATRPLVLLLNSDAQTSRASIAESAQFMAEHPDVGILGPRILNLDGSPQPSAWRDPSLLWMTLSAVGLSKLKVFNFEHYQEKVFAEPADVESVCGCAMLIRRDLLLELGGLDEDYFLYFEETDFCVRARQNGRRVVHAPVGEFRHEDGGTSKSVKLRTFLEFKRSEILFHRKHGGAASALAARGLLALGSAIRVPPLAVLSAFGTSERAKSQLALNAKGLRWLVMPSGGLVPRVDRS